MSAVLAPNDILQLRIWSVLGPQAAVNTLYYSVLSVGTPAATVADFLTNWNTTCVADYLALISNDATFKGEQARQVNRVPLFVMEELVTSAGPGTDASAAMGTQLCGLISYRSANAGPKFRGRLYLPFPAIDANTVDGVPTTTYRNNVAAFTTAAVGVTNISAGGRTATLQQGIYHRSSRTITPIVSAAIVPKWATQKRRGAFGRPNVSPI